jgi:hypothetical protein
VEALTKTRGRECTGIRLSFRMRSLVRARLNAEGGTWDREFLRLQYEALRAEILATQRRSFQIMSAGVVGLPLFSYLIQRPTAVTAPKDARTVPVALTTSFGWYLDLLLLALPLLVVVIALLYLADNMAVIRMGYFIRRHIERHAGVRGWEAWLELNRPLTRAAERHVTTAVSILFLLYYVGAVAMAWSAADELFIPFGVAVVVVSYFCLGIAIAAVFMSEMLPSTTTLGWRLKRYWLSADRRVNRSGNVRRHLVRLQSFSARTRAGRAPRGLQT